MSKKVLVTGSAGFIGFHLCEVLLKSGYNVFGLDNMNDYYEVSLKQARLDELRDCDGFRFIKGDLADKSLINELFKSEKFDYVVNLAAQAGVRYSLKNPQVYIDSNIQGFMNLLEACRNYPVKHLVYASSSSVYGLNSQMPFSTENNVDHPVSLYAATKKSNELMAHCYSHLFKIPTTGLRFFTVYGPWGRPDMALFLFTKAILEGKPIDVFNHGKMKRDFTYIDDIVKGVVGAMNNIPVPNPDWDSANPSPSSSSAPYKVYNIGNNTPVQLMDMISILEKELGKTAEKNLMPMQNGDVPATYADIDSLSKDVGFSPSTSIEVGIKNFVEWYLSYYKK